MSKRLTVIVVGATGGIGRVCVQFLVLCKFNVVLFSRTREKLVALAKQFPSDQVLVVAGDASNHSDVEKLFRLTKKRFGHVDGVIISAGTWQRLDLNKKPKEARAAFDLAYETFFLPTGVVAYVAQQIFRKQNRGLIVNISSHITLRHDLPGNHSYSPMKTAGHKLIRDLAYEFKHTKKKGKNKSKCRVRACDIAPAIVNTPDNAKLLKTKEKRKLAVQPESIARWIVKNFHNRNIPALKHFPAKKGLIV
jgi:NAD(P)-dependent dehydrogenase (short-subunit alcohol dehydrogenase family)